MAPKEIEHLIETEFTSLRGVRHTCESGADDPECHACVWFEVLLYLSGLFGLPNEQRHDLIGVSIGLMRSEQARRSAPVPGSDDVC